MRNENDLTDQEMKGILIDTINDMPRAELNRVWVFVQYKDLIFLQTKKEITIKTEKSLTTYMQAIKQVVNEDKCSFDGEFIKHTPKQPKK